MDRPEDWNARLLSVLSSDFGRCGLLVTEVYAHYAAAFPNQRYALWSIRRSANILQASGQIVKLGEYLQIPNHSLRIRKLGGHYQNVGRGSSNKKLHAKLEGHPNEDMIGIVDCGLTPDECEVTVGGPGICKYQQELYINFSVDSYNMNQKLQATKLIY